MRPAAGHWRKILLVYILQLFPCKWHPCARVFSLALLHPSEYNTLPPTRVSRLSCVYPLSSSFVSLCRGLVTRDDRTAAERNSSADAIHRAWTHRLTRATFESNPFVWDHVLSVDLLINFVYYFSWMKILLTAIFLRPFLLLPLNVLAI